MSEFTKTTKSVAALSEQTEALKSYIPSNKSTTSSPLTLSDLLSAQNLRDELASKVERYKSRLTEKDPVTGNARYGDNMKKKVQKLLDDFAETSNKIDDLISGGLLESFKKLEEEERLAEERRVAAEKKAEEERIEAKKLADEEARLSSMTEAQRQKEKEDEEREKLRVAAEAARHSRLQEEEEIRQREAAELEAERAWVASIEVSMSSFKSQLAVIPPSSKSILLQLYSQIKSHPDNENFRKIKIDNEKFMNDFGQHEGGKEVFLSAGWKLQTIDDPPAKILMLIEPNLEADMDGWMAWFDRIKEIVDLLS